MSTGAPITVLYHLALRGDWTEALAAGGAYHRSTVGRSLEEVGFIHCSFAGQVEATADRFYRGRDDVVLLTIEAGVLPVRVENQDGGDERFPHVYGPIPLGAVVRATPVPLLPDGRLAVAGLLPGGDDGG